MTDELDEEWIEEEGDAGDDEGQDEGTGSQQGGSSPSTSQRSTSESPTVVQPIAAYASLNKPRVPSSLRYAFTSSTASSQHTELAAHDLSSTAGTFVMRESSSPYNARGGQEESQLAAAVRALKGPSSGLGAAVAEEGGEAAATPVKGKQGVDRLGGLMRLFDPPSPPKVLPSSQIAAPSAEAFTFPPPTTQPRTSWKSIPHFSPTDNASTPIARPRNNNTGTPNVLPTFDATPSRGTYQPIPTPKPRERYLRSTAAAAAPPPSSPPTSLAPFPTTPAPTHSFSPAQTPRSELKLFEFQYDTFTRDHLAALVDEIDELGSAEPSLRRGAQKGDWETSFVDVRPQEGEEGDEGYESRDSAERSSKRIRLSPEERREQRRKMSSARGTLERRRRAGREVISPTGARGRLAYSARKHSLSSSTVTSLPFAHSLSQSAVKKPTTRDRLGEANALLDRIRARASEKESRNAEVVGPSYPDELDLESSDDDDAPPPLSLRPTTVSPRKLLRRLSASDEIDLELDALFPSPSPPSLALPLPNSPLPHLALAAQSSLRTALGSSTPPKPSSSSFVEPSSATRRHFARTPISPNKRRLRGRLEGVFGSEGESASSGHVRHRSITTIGPGDVQALLASAGPSRMVFDREQARWIKSRTLSGVGTFEEGESGSTEEDPFRDCEVTRSSEKELGELEKEVLEGLEREDLLSGLGITAGTPGTPRVVVSPPDANYFERAPVEEREESEEEVWGAKGESEEETGTTEGELEREESPFHLFRAAVQRGQVEEEDEEEEEHSDDRVSAILPRDIAEPLDLAPSQTPSRPLRSSPNPQATSIALSPTALVPPRSALKPTVRSHSEPNLATPKYRLVEADKSPRSVSFSDGKTSGRIEGLHEREERERAGSRLKFEVGRGEGTQFEIGEPGSLEMESPEREGDGTVGSLRTRGIDRALQDLEFSGPEDTPTASNPSRSSIIIGSFESAPKVRPRTSRSPSQSRTFRRTTAPDATFLTECSFGVSHERLVQYITDVEPFEPDWEGLNSINLAGKGVESLVRLKEFLPKLDEGNFNDNEITFLTGIPSTIRTLLVSSNKISDLTSFSHLRNLERIDISDNQLDSVHQFGCLVHLRELKADNNGIRDLSGLAQLDGLLRLSLRGNKVETVDFGATKWTRLETLNLSRNKISMLLGLERLQSLSLLNLDHNQLCALEPSAPMTRLRVLRLCDNPLETLDVAFAPKLRTLFVDGARLGAVEGTDQLRKLENLSVRDQSGGALTLSMNQIQDVKRLYLSGNPIPTSFPSEKFYNLIYLELAMCQLTSLPADFAAVIPNVRVLNLNFSFLEDLEPLIGLTRLKKLSVLGARLSKCRPVAAVLETLSELESVDLRMNPLTLAYYPPLLLQPTESLPPHSDYQILHPDDDHGPISKSSQWTAIDRKFRKALPDAWYFKRMTYRAVLLQVVPTLVSLDGVDCAKERPRLAKTLGGLAKLKGRS